MNIALNPPSHSLDSTLLSYSGSSNTSTPRFIHSPVRSPNRATSRSLSPQHRSPSPNRPGLVSAQEVGSHDSIEREPSPPESLVLSYDPQQMSDHTSDPVMADQAEGQDHDRIDIEMEDREDVIDIPPPPPPPLRSGSNTPVAEHPAGVAIPTPSDHPGPSELEREGANSVSDVPPEEDVEEDSEDESAYEDDSSFWATFQEDESVPSDEELLEINRRTEISALDHTHWETMIHERIDDPEYVVEDVGRLTWTLHGFHGTKENPNKERVMRSPSAIIGGYEWNIKLLPRGDETTDQVSVYIECIGPVKHRDVETNGFAEGEKINQAIPEEILRDYDESAEDGRTGRKSTSSHASSGTGPLATPPWDVAAQIGCVMYNPDEPRVGVHEKSAHHFENGSTDWGWVRFHGPWNTIHQRQHLQRQALLRNDTLAFTAYIRTFRDQTKALWWHTDKDNTWNSLSKTGYRSLVARDSDVSALAAALSAWMHLAPFNEIITKINVPESGRDSRARFRPLHNELHKLLKAKFSTNSTVSTVSLEYLETLFDWYDWELCPCPDVIEIWETLQHLLNKELCKVGDENPTSNVLSSFMTLRQVFYSNMLTDSGFLPQDKLPNRIEARNTQEVLNTLIEDNKPDNKLWNSFHGVSGLNASQPLVLQLELHRQDYDIKARKWRRLTHRIELNEFISLKLESSHNHSMEYQLYGMIIHSGKLGSGDYYTIVRPGGPGSQWVQFGGVGHDQSRVTNLTTKQAVQAHEGTGVESEGESPIAYIALYIRSDALPNALPRFGELQMPSLQANGIPKDDMRQGSYKLPEIELASLPKTDMITVTLFDSCLFSGWADRGILDPLINSDANPANRSTFSLQVPVSMTLHNVRELLIEKLGYADITERCWLWAMSILPATHFDRNRLMPVLSYPEPQKTIGSYAESDGECRLWLHRVYPSNMPLTRPNSAKEEHEMDINLIHADAIDQVVTENEAATISDDVVMSGIQDSEQVSFTPEVTTRVDDFWELVPKQVYLFVKNFNLRQQKLTGVGSYLASNEARIGDILRENGLMSEDKKYDLYVEERARLRKTPISAMNTLSEANIFIGSVLVITEHLLEELTLDLTKAGQIDSLASYYQQLESFNDPNYQQPRFTSCYFGSLYISAENKHGPVHGHCIRIETFGDAYFGDCVLGIISGKGTMYYANGDTYFGEWLEELPNGQGKMIYGKTGNTYIGGWKNGKRHGKGMMHFEIADEDLEMCRICYEVEMDALFFRCGHVVACEDCARQVKDCPVCRKPVDAVVKIWKT